MPHLNKREIDALPPGMAKGTWHADDEMKGFFVVSYASGKKVFFCRYRTAAGRRKTIKLGQYGTVTPDAARRRAKEYLSEAALGGDPVAARDKARATPTWAEWTERYVDRIKLRKKSPREDLRFLGFTEDSPYAALRSRWGDRLVTEITTEDVETFRATIGRDHKVAANRWLASVRACFSAARKSKLVPGNPASGLPLFLEGVPRSRVLDDREMTRLLAALEKEEDVYGAAALRLIVETGCRRSEILTAKWTDFDLEADVPTWRIPSPKAGRPQTIPLASSTVALLERLPKTGEYVIPGRSEGRHRSDLRGSWERALARAGLTGADVRIHDLRRSFGLRVARAAGLHVASKLLRHANMLVTERVYAPLGLEELGRAMQQHAEVLPFQAKKGA